MNPLVAAAVRVQSALQERGWRFCLIGGLAVARWGEPRATQDVDFSVFVDFGREREFIASMLEEFLPMFAEAETIALQCRVLPLSIDGIKADLSIAGFPFEEEIVDRSSEFTYEAGASLVTVSAEDLIVMKALAGRPTDLRDIAGIAHRQADSLDTAAVIVRATALKEVAPDPAFLSTLQSILKQPTDYL